jgi:hypothetical protein
MLDTRSVLPARLASVGYTAAQFAVLAGVNETRFSRILRGLIPLSGDDALRFLRLSDELLELARVLEPLRLSEDPHVTEIMLNDFRSRREHWSQLNLAMSEIRRNIEETLAAKQ